MRSMMSAFLAREPGLPPRAWAIVISSSRSLRSRAERSRAVESIGVATSGSGVSAGWPQRTGAVRVQRCRSEPPPPGVLGCCPVDARAVRRSPPGGTGPTLARGPRTFESRLPARSGRAARRPGEDDRLALAQRPPPLEHLVELGADRGGLASAPAEVDLVGQRLGSVELGAVPVDHRLALRRALAAQRAERGALGHAPPEPVLEAEGLLDHETGEVVGQVAAGGHRGPRHAAAGR